MIKKPRKIFWWFLILALFLTPPMLSKLDLIGSVNAYEGDAYRQIKIVRGTGESYSGTGNKRFTAMILAGWGVGGRTRGHKKGIV
jgi:hypothetical protein